MRKRYQTATTNYKLLEEFAKKNRKFPTEAESALWYYLKGGVMGEHFRRQHVLQDYIPDFICLSKKLIIEIDGGYHEIDGGYQSGWGTTRKRRRTLRRIGKYGL